MAMPNKTFFDVILDEFDTKDEAMQLDEGVVPFSPFIAYAAFKQRVFNFFKNNKLFQKFKEGGELKKKIKGSAEVGAEKIKAGLGAKSKGMCPVSASVTGNFKSVCLKSAIKNAYWCIPKFITETMPHLFGSYGIGTVGKEIQTCF